MGGPSVRKTSSNDGDSSLMLSDSDLHSSRPSTMPSLTTGKPREHRRLHRLRRLSCCRLLLLLIVAGGFAPHLITFSRRSGVFRIWDLVRSQLPWSTFVFVPGGPTLDAPWLASFANQDPLVLLDEAIALSRPDYLGLIYMSVISPKAERIEPEPGGQPDVTSASGAVTERRAQPPNKLAAVAPLTDVTERAHMDKNVGERNVGKKGSDQEGIDGEAVVISGADEQISSSLLLPQPANLVRPVGNPLVHLKGPDIRLEVEGTNCSYFPVTLKAVARMARRLENIVRGINVEVCVSSDCPKASSQSIVALSLFCSVEILVPQFGDDESYELSILASDTSASSLKLTDGDSGVRRLNVRITATTTTGILFGLESVLASVLLVDELQVAEDVDGKTILAFQQVAAASDYPAIPWRGLLIDVARRFQTLDDLRRHIDAMTMCKLNVLHLHLTDDQGWRFEVKKWPKFHEVGGEGTFFRQTELRQLVKYAADRGIRIVPEVDVPGHLGSALVAYPKILLRRDQEAPRHPVRRFGTFDTAVAPIRQEQRDILFDVFVELASVFPDRYVHFGGDEVSKRNYRREEIKLAGFEPNELQVNYTVDLVQRLATLNRLPVGWGEIANELLAPYSLTVQKWLSEPSESRLERMNLPNIVVSRHFYFDHQRSASWHYSAHEESLARHRIRQGLDSYRLALTGPVFGIEGCLWSEHMSRELLDAAAWPVGAVIAERGWAGGGGTVRVVPRDDFLRRMDRFSSLLNASSIGLSHLNFTFPLLRALVRGADSTAKGRNLDIAVNSLFVVASAIAKSSSRSLLVTTETKLDTIADMVQRESVAARNFELSVRACSAVGGLRFIPIIKRVLGSLATNHDRIFEILPYIVLPAFEGFGDDLEPQEHTSRFWQRLPSFAAVGDAATAEFSAQLSNVAAQALKFHWCLEQDGKSAELCLDELVTPLHPCSHRSSLDPRHKLWHGSPELCRSIVHHIKRLAWSKDSSSNMRQRTLDVDSLGG